jgi:FkbM family methyltransferase
MQSAHLKEMVRCLSLPVRVEAVALSDTQGEAKLRILEKDLGRSTIESENSLEDPDGSARYEVAVPMRRLDDYALESVGFIKIDVEGHELAVLRGGLATIRRCFPTLLIEIEDRHKPNACKEVFDFLSALGYEGYFIQNKQLVSVSDFDSNAHQNPSNIGGWQSGWKKFGVYINNFFFLPSGSRQRLQAALEKSALSKT